MNAITNTVATVLAGLLAAGSAGAQDLGRKVPPTQAEPVVIENAVVHTVSGDPIPAGYVYFAGGEIKAVGPLPLPRFDGPVKIIDGTGKHVYPGLIAAYSQIGLIEIAAVRATLDMAEVGGGTPEARAVIAVNPDSTLIPVTRSNGVLIAGVFPRTNFASMLAYFSGPGGLFPGRPGVVRLDGWTWEEMTIRDDAGVVINWPFPRPVDAWWMDKSREEQQADVDRALRAIDDTLAQARAYAAGPANQPADVRFESMRRLFPGKEGSPPANPIFVEANDFDAIHQAVAMADKHGLRIVIVGGRDALLCADLLKRHNVPVIVLGTYSFPRRDDSPYDEAFALPAALEEAGIAWCLASGEEAANERNLPYAAGLAVAHGLDRRTALEAITIRPAKILGVADRFGSIEPGKSATLFIADGDILEITTNVSAAFIDGRAADMTDKHKVLAEKYRERYRQMGAIPPAGTAKPDASRDGPDGAARPPAPRPEPAPAAD